MPLLLIIMLFFVGTYSVTVTQCDDSGIRTAIDQGRSQWNYNGGSQSVVSVTFSCTGTIHLNKPILIDYDIDIDGGNKVTLDGRGQNRIFIVAYLKGSNCALFDGSVCQWGIYARYPWTSSSNYLHFTMKNIKIQNGNADDYLRQWKRSSDYSSNTNDMMVRKEGGCIFMGEHAYTAIDRVTFSGCKAYCDYSPWEKIMSLNEIHCVGGALFTQYGKEVTITNSKFENNISGDKGGGLSTGWSTAKVTITNTLFKNNRAEGMGERGGGAVYMQSTPTAIIHDCTFVENEASLGGGVYNMKTNLDMKNCLFKDNKATDFNCCNKGKCSFMTDGCWSDKDMRCAQNANPADHTCGGKTYQFKDCCSDYDGYGGGLYVDGAMDNKGEIGVRDSKFLDNTSTKFGGGLQWCLYGTDAGTILNSAFCGNQVIGLQHNIDLIEKQRIHGAAVEWACDGSLDLRDSVFGDNSIINWDERWGYDGWETVAITPNAANPNQNGNYFTPKKWVTCRGGGNQCIPGANQYQDPGRSICNTLNVGTGCGSCNVGGGPADTNTSPTCGSGKTSCTGDCVDTKVSNQHCGVCDSVCKNNQQCTDGKCGCPKDTCYEWCVDWQSDVEHCGGCTKPCPATYTCESGSCKAPPGSVVPWQGSASGSCGQCDPTNMDICGCCIAKQCGWSPTAGVCAVGGQTTGIHADACKACVCSNNDRDECGCCKGQVNGQACGYSGTFTKCYPGSETSIGECTSTPKPPPQPTTPSFCSTPDSHGLPANPGCYVYYRECNQNVPKGSWERDVWGEQNRGAGVSRYNCVIGRRSDQYHWCGATSVHDWYFVPQPGKFNGEQCECKGGSSCLQVPPEKRGCYFRYPSCAGNGQGDTHGFIPDTWGMNNAGSGDNWINCLQNRQRDMDSYCKLHVEMFFVDKDQYYMTTGHDFAHHQAYQVAFEHPESHTHRTQLSQVTLYSMVAVIGALVVALAVVALYLRRSSPVESMYIEMSEPVL